MNNVLKFKNIFSVFGIIALAAVTGFLFVSCGDGAGGGGNGGGKTDTVSGTATADQDGEIGFVLGVYVHEKEDITYTFTSSDLPDPYKSFTDVSFSDVEGGNYGKRLEGLEPGKVYHWKLTVEYLGDEYEKVSIQPQTDEDDVGRITIGLLYER